MSIRCWAVVCVTVGGAWLLPPGVSPLPPAVAAPPVELSVSLTVNSPQNMPEILPGSALTQVPEPASLVLFAGALLLLLAIARRRA